MRRRKRRVQWIRQLEPTVTVRHFSRTRKIVVEPSRGHKYWWETNLKLDRKTTQKTESQEKDPYND